MIYLGDFPVGGKVSFLWNTHAIAGESITRATDGTLKIFKSHATAATWATERSSLAGVTQLEDFDATGMHSVYIDLSDNTDAGFYAAGNEYQVAIVGAVVDGKTVNVPLACFSIKRAGGLSTTAIDNLEASALGIVRGQAVTGTLSTTQMTTNLTEATDDHYIGRTIIWTSGVLAGQASDITDYDGTTKKLVFSALTEAPSNGDAFVLV
jgi:hypothetical protein